MEKVVDAELVVGIVGRMGVDTGSVFRWIEDVLHSLRYTSHRIKLTDFLKSKKFDGVDLDETSIEGRYRTYIDACNLVREKTNRNDFFASYAIERIIGIRASAEKGSADSPLPRTAYVVDQIKRPEEAEALRGIYGTLLHKSADSRTSPYPGQTYPTTFVTGMPSAVKPFSTATRT